MKQIALHWAAVRGSISAADVLLRNGARFNTSDIHGFKACLTRMCKHCFTPLHWIVLKDNIEAGAILAYAGTIEELLIKDHSGFTPYQLASSRGHRRLSFLIRNKWDFFLLIWMGTRTSSISAIVTLHVFGMMILTRSQSYQISQNITINESSNAHRYDYLQGHGGQFRYPYNHGIKKNCSNFFIYGGHFR
ncbi:hypothetical protein ZOSMA_96G00670 [Zostera marina]|uniref:Uncharacterized protein n=1 Tax=Zostera marina TaxID=29655 RepID=A0A0K9NHZ2_ZOSMR|nr:hypothetical protein ZOSMA_96G00670 [Zostera marina]